MIRKGKPGQRVRYKPWHNGRFRTGRTGDNGEFVVEVDFDPQQGDTATIISTPRPYRAKRRHYHIRLDPPNKGVLEASPKELFKLEGATR